MLTPEIIITVADLRIKGCVNMTIDKDVTKLSDSGTVELALRVMLKEKIGTKGKSKILELNDVIKQGSEITIEAGYKEVKVQEIFKGYVTNIDPSDVLKLTLEDEIYTLRKLPVVLSKKDIGLKELLTELLKDSCLKVHDKTQDIKIDQFAYKGNVAGALAKIKESLSLTIYIDNGMVYAGGEQLNKKGEINAVYGLNIFKHNVNYCYKDVNPVLIEVIGKKKDNTEVKVTAGEVGGSKQTYHLYNVTDKETLQAVADEKLRIYSQNGFKGNVGLMFVPFAKVGGVVKYKNENYKSNDSGSYFINRVKYTSTANEGLMQEVYLGGSLDDK